MGREALDHRPCTGWKNSFLKQLPSALERFPLTLQGNLGQGWGASFVVAATAEDAVFAAGSTLATARVLIALGLRTTFFVGVLSR